MTTLYESAAATYRQSTKLDPLKVAITLVLIVPFIIGWTARLAWVLIALLWTGMSLGWQTASKQVDARQVDTRGS